MTADPVKLAKFKIRNPAGSDEIILNLKQCFQRQKMKDQDDYFAPEHIEPNW